MFSIVRFILIVGVIFYYSPVRQQGEETAAIEAFLMPKKSEPAIKAPATDNPGQLETVWKALPDSAKQAVVDRILTTSGFPVSGPGKPSDTLLPEDLGPEVLAGAGARPAGAAEPVDLDLGLEQLASLPPLREALAGPERRIILRALELNGGNRTRTAAMLDVNRSTLFNKMRKYGLMNLTFGPR